MKHNNHYEAQQQYNISGVVFSFSKRSWEERPIKYNAEYNKRKIMTNTEELKQSLQEKAWKHATEILKDAGIVKEDRFYALRLYEMQFNIYRNLKMCFDIE